MLSNLSSRPRSRSPRTCSEKATGTEGSDLLSQEARSVHEHQPNESVGDDKTSREEVTISVLALDGSEVANMCLDSAADANVLKHVTVSEVLQQLSDITGLPRFRLQLSNGIAKLVCTQTLHQAGLQGDACLHLIKIGVMLLTASEDGSAKLWNSDTGSCVHTIQGDGAMLSAGFAPTGSCCFVTSCATSIDVWTMENWKRLGSHCIQNGIITWSSHAPSVLVALPDGVVQELFVYAKADENPIIRVYSRHEGRVNSAVHSNNNTMILSSSADRTSKLWIRQDCKCQWTFIGHTDAVNSAEFSFDDGFVVTASCDCTAKVWSMATGRELETFQHDRSVSRARFSNDAKLIVTGCYDSNARLWDRHLGTCLRVFSGHEGAVLDVIFAAQDKSIGTASRDGSAKLWNIESGECVQTFKGHNGAVVSLSLSL